MNQDWLLFLSFAPVLAHGNSAVQEIVGAGVMDALIKLLSPPALLGLFLSPVFASCSYRDSTGAK